MAWKIDSITCPCSIQVSIRAGSQVQNPCLSLSLSFGFSCTGLVIWFESAALSLGLFGRRELCGYSAWLALEQRTCEVTVDGTGRLPPGPWESGWTSGELPPAHLQKVF